MPHLLGGLSVRPLALLFNDPIHYPHVSLKLQACMFPHERSCLLHRIIIPSPPPSVLVIEVVPGSRFVCNTITRPVRAMGTQATIEVFSIGLTDRDVVLVAALMYRKSEN